MTRVSWRNNNVCFLYLRDLSQLKDVTMTGPLWLVNKSYPEDLAWNRATSRCGLPTPFFSLSWTELSDEGDLVYSPRWGFGRGTEDSYSALYSYIIRVSSLQNVFRRVVLTHTLILLIIVDCHNYLHEHSNSSSMKFGNFVFTKV